MDQFIIYMYDFGALFVWRVRLVVLTYCLSLEVIVRSTKWICKMANLLTRQSPGPGGKFGTV